MIDEARFLVRKDEDYEGWLEARRGGVTATEVAEAMTPAGFERMVERRVFQPEIEDNGYMRFGRDWEPWLSDFCEVEFGVHANEWLIAGEDPTHLATPDGLSSDHRLIGEYKTTGKDWETVEKLPVRYVRQVQWQLHVTGAERAVVAWLLREDVNGEFVPGWFQPKTGFLWRDEDMIAKLVETAERLLERVNG